MLLDFLWWIWGTTFQLLSEERRETSQLLFFYAHTSKKVNYNYQIKARGIHVNSENLALFPGIRQIYNFVYWHHQPVPVSVLVYNLLTLRADVSYSAFTMAHSFKNLSAFAVKAYSGSPVNVIAARARSGWIIILSEKQHFV